MSSHSVAVKVKEKIAMRTLHHQHKLETLTDFANVYKVESNKFVLYAFFRFT
jgi:hypothetical protein